METKPITKSPDVMEFDLSVRRADRPLLWIEFALFVGLSTMQVGWMLPFNRAFWQVLPLQWFNFEENNFRTEDAISILHVATSWIVPFGAALIVAFAIAGWIRLSIATNWALGGKGRQGNVWRVPLVRVGLHSQILMLFAYILWVTPAPWFTSSQDSRNGQLWYLVGLGWALTVLAIYGFGVFRGFILTREAARELEPA